MITGAALSRCSGMVIAATDGPMPQIRELSFCWVKQVGGAKDRCLLEQDGHVASTKKTAGADQEEVRELLERTASTKTPQSSRVPALMLLKVKRNTKTLLWKLVDGQLHPEPARTWTKTIHAT